jgi:hypothetical protein
MGNQLGRTNRAQSWTSRDQFGDGELAILLHQRFLRIIADLF